MEYNINESVNLEQRVFTGKNLHFLEAIKTNLESSHKARLIVSFVMLSGVKLLTKHLIAFLQRGGELIIITTDYMNVTEPVALYYLYKELGSFYPKFKIYFFNQKKISYHPKAYLFENNLNEKKMLIGSSNLSYSALVTGIEWNYLLTEPYAESDIQKYWVECEKLLDNSIEVTLDIIREYEGVYRNSGFYPENIDEWRMVEDKVAEESGCLAHSPVSPINFQIPALLELNLLREQGINKAMVIAATGLGKTYLIAFDTIKYKKILFIAHREEILDQASSVFNKVAPQRIRARFSREKVNYENTDILFATVQTLGKTEYLNMSYFKPDTFDYLVIDEFHHASANLYQNILNYFKPDFLLGVTATPDRMDSKDIYKLCNYNIAYNCDFKIAINNGWLVPFKYFGLFDDTVDYENVKMIKGQYDIEDLTRKLNIHKRVAFIYNQYLQFDLKKTIAFCAGTAHADYMTDYFRKMKVNCISIHSQNSTIDSRKEIIKQFSDGLIKVLFCVDIFNEGFDLPEIDSVMFLRPTESKTVFLQQMGRGLRRTPNKQYLTILDFVGNYSGAYLKPYFLSSESYSDPAGLKLIKPNQKSFDYPLNCEIHFDFRLINLFNKETTRLTPIKERLIQEYIDIKEYLNRKPSVTDIYTYSSYPVDFFCKQFSGWLGLLSQTQDLSDFELSIRDTLLEEFIDNLFSTAFTKSYKIPVIHSLLQSDMPEPVSIDQITDFFIDFYKNNPVHLHDIDPALRDFNHQKIKALIKKNPVKYLNEGPSGKFFRLSDHSFSFSDDMIKAINNRFPELRSLVEDILNFRTLKYYNQRYDLQTGKRIYKEKK